VTSAFRALEIVVFEDVLVMSKAPLGAIAVPHHSRVEASGVDIILCDAILISKLYRPHDLPPSLRESVIGGSNGHIVISFIVFVTHFRKHLDLGIFAGGLEVLSSLVGLRDH
jgi:hypothetical protein